MLEPCPPNTFREFVSAYFDRCDARVPQIEAVAGKWALEDLVPGLSDFDTRLIVGDATSTDDWCRISSVVGYVHLELLQEYPLWARNLEHLPGVNLRWDELLAADQYFTELSKWSFYGGPVKLLAAAEDAIATHKWDAADELHHWRTVAKYYGRYDRTIDPPINLGPFESKYALHSRCMHYFAPTVQAAVSLAQRRTIRGKRKSLRLARDLFPDPELIDMVEYAIDSHYEVPRWLAEPGMSVLDERMDRYLQSAVTELAARTGFITASANPTPAMLRQAVAGVGSVAPLGVFFESIRFARLLKGRLWFYAQETPGFDSDPLIARELNRIRQNYYDTPLRLYGCHVAGVDAPPDRVLDMLHGSVLDSEQVAAWRKFLLVCERPSGALKTDARAFVDCFDGLLHALERVRAAAARHQTAMRAGIRG